MIAPLNIGRKADFTQAVVKPEHRYRHFFLIGSTGVGKSTILKWFWFHDCLMPVAKILIDPSGGFSKEAYSMSKDAIYCSLQNPVGLNPLMLPYDPNDICDIVIESVNQCIRLLTDNVVLTVRMRSILRETIIYCIKNNRRRLDQVVDRLRVAKEHHETRQSLIDRIQMFIQDERMHKIFCEMPVVDLEELITNKRTLIVDTFGMNEDKMIFTGMLVTQMVKNYFRYTRRDKYEPLILYIDEAHNFVNQNTFNLLREGRKFSISAVMASTDFAGIDDKLTHTILSNVGTIVCFKCGFREATQVSREFKTLKAEDLQFLDKYMVAYKTPDDEGIAKTRPAPVVKLKPIVSICKPMSDRLTMKWFPLRKSYPLSNDSEHLNGSSLKVTGKNQKSRCAEGTASICEENFHVGTMGDVYRVEAKDIT